MYVREIEQKKFKKKSKELILTYQNFISLGSNTPGHRGQGMRQIVQKRLLTIFMNLSLFKLSDKFDSKTFNRGLEPL